MSQGQEHRASKASSGAAAEAAAAEAMSKRPRRWVSVAIPALIATAFALILVFILVSPVLLPALNVATGADAAHADAMVAAISHPFPPRGTPQAPAAQAIYADFTRRSTTLLVYGVFDPAEQQRIVQQARQAQQRLQPSKPVEIRFLERELWVKDGWGFVSRGKEQLLRRELIR